MIAKKLKVIPIALCMIFTGYLNLDAQDSTYTIKPGDTLFRIAQRFDVDIDQLRSWNNLQSNSLEVGETLYITNPEKNSLSYKVKPGDTLFSISKKLNVTIAELRSWNGLEGNNLEVGQRLVIYRTDRIKLDSAKVASVETDTTESLISKEEKKQNSYYTVKSGDSLYKIAQQFDMTVAELKQLNDLQDNQIRVGQQLTVSVAKQEQSVASLQEDRTMSQGSFTIVTLPQESPSPVDAVLDTFKMEYTELEQLNPSLDLETLTAGDEVTVLSPPNRRFANPYRASVTRNNLGTVSADVYKEQDIGQSTTSGSLYNPDALTAAHSSIALGTVVFIQSPTNNRGTYVLINDRMSSQGIKLSNRAYRFLDLHESQSAKIQIISD